MKQKCQRCGKELEKIPQDKNYLLCRECKEVRIKIKEKLGDRLYAK